mmetsp:Transcript_112856/g.319229  ORF Transcript_112856/g.319229 Transcript_112856/m.319229 type:complete len:409 (+) Transcript_112856:117-1343(+)
MADDLDEYFNPLGSDDDTSVVFRTKRATLPSKARAASTPGLGVKRRAHSGETRATPRPEESDRLKKQILKARSISSHHIDRVGYAVPPEVPFVVRFGPRKCIFYISFANILAVDLDVKDGITKEGAAVRIRRVAEKRGLKMRLFETDDGMHGYCTSRTFDCRDAETWAVMAEMSCDECYVCSVAFHGFATRLSPKALSTEQGWEARVPRSREAFEAQFVKRPWRTEPVVGAAPEDPALAAMVRFTWVLSETTRKLPFLYEAVHSNLAVDRFLRKITSEALRLFQEAQASHPEAVNRWLRKGGAYAVPYSNDLSQWYPTTKNGDEGEEATRHPVTGRPIKVLRSAQPGAWCYCYDKEVSPVYGSQEQAKRAAVQRFLAVRPTNVQLRDCAETGAPPAKKRRGRPPKVAK